MSGKKLTKEEFIERAKVIHGDKYDYSKVNYVNNKTRVLITCPIHGEFWQTPNSHLSGCGCPNCGVDKKAKGQTYTQEEFISRAIQLHGDKYDYSRVKYINSRTKVEIVCPKHGSFYQTPNSHLTGSGCPKCSKTAKSNTKEFIEKAIKVHGDRYDYRLVDYSYKHIPIKIICPEHGVFEQTPNSHLMGRGCPKCKKEGIKQVIYGFGINDYIGNVVINGKEIKSYGIWNGMIRRCYSSKSLLKNPTYKNCSVCKEWSSFSKFKEWFDQHYVEGWQIDKDLLSPVGNKMYSPNTCCFLPHQINSFLSNIYHRRDKLPLGVTWDERKNKYIAKVGFGKKYTILGFFDNIEDAYNVYLINVKKRLVKLANKYKRHLEKRAYDKLINFKVIVRNE